MSAMIIQKKLVIEKPDHLWHYQFLKVLWRLTFRKIIYKDIDFFIPDNIILKKIDPNTGIFETKNSSIIEYFTKDQLETINNLNKVNTIGGIN